MIKTVLTLILYSTICFAEALSLDDEFEKGAKIKVSVISKDEANNLFSEFKDLELPMQAEGCFARATVMARQAEQSNIEMAKIWVFGKMLDGISLNGEKGFINFHVAPVAFVKALKSETPELYVFDPFLFKEPVSIKKWLDILKKPKAPGASQGYIKNQYFSSRFQYRSIDGKQEKKKNAWDPEDLEDLEVVLNKLYRDADAEGIDELSSGRDPQNCCLKKKKTKKMKKRPNKKRKEKTVSVSQET